MSMCLTARFIIRISKHVDGWKKVMGACCLCQVILESVDVGFQILALLHINFFIF